MSQHSREWSMRGNKKIRVSVGILEAREPSVLRRSTCEMHLVFSQAEYWDATDGAGTWRFSATLSWKKQFWTEKQVDKHVWLEWVQGD